LEEIRDLDRDELWAFWGGESVAHHGGEGFGHAGVEVSAGIMEDAFHGDGVRCASAIGPVGGDGVVGIDDGKQASCLGYLFTR
jgi:hypothetical protein